jgi:biopolymer transport protein ExbD
MNRTKTKPGERFGKEQDNEVDMTPMIDIVFNLLIFFMCATKFRSEEGLIEAFLPKGLGTASAKQSDPIDLGQVRVKLLWVDSGGRATEGKQGLVVIKIDQTPFNSPGELEALKVPEASPVWKALHERLLEFKEAYSGASPHGLPVIIDARKQIPTKYVISTLNEIVRAKVKDVTFAQPAIPF